MTENQLRALVTAIERQIELGFGEHGDPLELEATRALLQQTRIRLAAAEMNDPAYAEEEG